MTNKQPEALRLAAWLNEGAWHQMTLGDAEAAGRELRRLSAENAGLKADAERWQMFVASMVDYIHAGGDTAFAEALARAIPEGKEGATAEEFTGWFDAAIRTAKEQS